MQIKIAILCDKVTIRNNICHSGIIMAEIEGVSVDSILQGIRPIDMVRVVGSSEMRKAVNLYVKHRKELKGMDK